MHVPFFFNGAICGHVYRTRPLRIMQVGLPPLPSDSLPFDFWSRLISSDAALDESFLTHYILADL